VKRVRPDSTATSIAAAIAAAYERAGVEGANRNIGTIARDSMKAITLGSRGDVRWSIASRIDWQPPRNRYDPDG